MGTESQGRLEAYVRARWTRQQGGITGLAASTGLTRETLYSWFRGETELSLANLRTLSAALGVRPWELVAALDGDEPVVPDDQVRRIVREELDRLPPR